jgi:hypothetical protein
MAKVLLFQFPLRVRELGVDLIFVLVEYRKRRKDSAGGDKVLKKPSIGKRSRRSVWIANGWESGKIFPNKFRQNT